MTEIMLGALIVLACTIIEGVAQVFLKISVLRIDKRYAWIALGVVFYLVEIGLYTIALRVLAVSTAFAISSLSFVTVVMFAAWFLREKVTATRWLGILLILGGVTLIVVYA